MSEPSAPGRSRSNPFEITKATHLGDAEINATWVDLQGDASFFQLADPTSLMPRFLLSGKGGGRTHLMRYFSGPLQSLRAFEEGRDVLDDGYLGIWYRCSGLNSGRFSGKGISDDQWADVFAYYMDLVLAHECLHTANAALLHAPERAHADAEIAATIAGAFDEYPRPEPSSTADVQETLQELRREVDLAVNNAWGGEGLSVRIRVGRGRLPFAVPEAFQRVLERPITWLYLLDELENITGDQQVYVNTLIRENEPPTSFIVGSRLYGFRTRRTYSADEENKEGSEFYPFYLDRTYFDEHERFKRFCRDLVAQRLIEGGHVGGDREEVVEALPGYFFRYEDSPLHEVETRFAAEAGRQPHVARLESQLSRERSMSEGDIRAVAEALAVDRYPLLEKLNVFLLYQEWARGGDDLLGAAGRIRRESEEFLSGRRDGRYASAYKHRKADLLAHLLWQHERKQRYLGFDVFVRMAGGLPRNLMVILKYVFREATFRGESVWEPGGIGEATQLKAVREASDWFFRDSKPLGPVGEDVQAAVRRLGGLFRSLRYADKPAEVSLVTFSVDRQALTPRARRTIDGAMHWSMLIEVGERRERNTGESENRYQLHPMLAPRWDLPLVRRGDIGLTAGEANAIFDPDHEDEFADVRRTRLARLNVPFRQVTTGTPPPQSSLLDEEDERK